MISKKNISIVVSSAIFSISAQAAVFGTYVDGNGQYPQYSNKFVFAGIEPRSNKEVRLCVDKTSRKVPGKLLISNYTTGQHKCYVPWKGKEYANTEYDILLEDTYNYYTWKPFSLSTKLEILRDGVTAGGIDKGDYTYHCKLWGYSAIVGKYVPGSRDVCYYPWYGKEYVDVPFLVLVKEGAGGSGSGSDEEITVLNASFNVKQNTRNGDGLNSVTVSSTSTAAANTQLVNYKWVVDGKARQEGTKSSFNFVNFKARAATIILYLTDSDGATDSVKQDVYLKAGEGCGGPRGQICF